MTWARFVTLLVWMAVGASALAWWMSAARPGIPPGSPVPVAPEAPVAPADWSLMLRGAPSSDQAAAAAAPLGVDASRFRLLGVAGPARGGERSGVALLSVDGAPPRALKVGQVIDGRMAVLEITGHEVRIGPVGGPAAITLQAPLLPPPATGTMPGIAPS